MLSLFIGGVIGGGVVGGGADVCFCGNLGYHQIVDARRVGK